MHLAGKSVWGKPLYHGIRVEEGPVNALRFGGEDTVQANGVGIVCGHTSWFGFGLHDDDERARRFRTFTPKKAGGKVLWIGVAVPAWNLLNVFVLVRMVYLVLESTIIDN
jgi:hypothetical protein